MVRANASIKIRGMATLKEAREGEISFYLAKSYRSQLKETKASAVLAERDLLADARDLLPETCALLTHSHTKQAFIDTLSIYTHLYPSMDYSGKKQAHIADGVRLGKDVSYGQVNIGPGCIIGDRTQLADGVCLGAEVEIGKDCLIYSNVVLYPRTILGNGVIIHSCSVIGADGYSYDSKGGTHRKIPHMGRVVLEDDVEVGANSCVDRSTLGTTRIGKGSKLDNFVQIGHNVDIGEHVLLCAHVAIGGSASVGDGTVCAGKSGVIDHVKVGKNNRIFVGSIVCHNTADNADLWGVPARPKKEVLREVILIKKLPRIYEILKDVKKNKQTKKK